MPTPVLRAYGFDDSRESYVLYQCPKCRLTVIDPIPEPEKLAAYYRQTYYGSNETKFFAPVEFFVKLTNIRRAKALLRFLPGFGPRTRVIDIGCGRGNFLRSLSRMGLDCFGIEVPGFSFPAVPEIDGKITFLHGSLEKQKFEAGLFDAVSIWHVLEHVSDPSGTVREISRILKQGGVLALAVPNYGSNQARFFGRHWFHLDLPRHLYHFSKFDLLKILESNGLGVLSVSTQSLDMNLYGFIQSFMNIFLYRTRPNEFFTLLKFKGAPTIKRVLLMTIYLPLAALLFPLAVIENFISVALGKGGTLIVYAKKNLEISPTRY